MPSTDHSFDEQIRERQGHDALHVRRAVRALAGTVNREQPLGSGMRLNDADDTVLADLCRAFGLPERDVPSELTDFDEKVAYLLESRGVMHRPVTLDGQWWKDMYGPVLVRRREDGAHVALLQDRFGRYYYRDRARGTEVRIGGHAASEFEPDAICFYKPLPMRKLTARDMMHFALTCPTPSDWAVVLVGSLVVTLVGMVVPSVTGLLFSSVIPAGSDLRLATTAALLVSVAVGTYLLGVFNAVANARVTQKVSGGLSSATFARLISLTAEFFKAYSSGDVASRMSAMQSLGTTLMGALLNGGVSCILSLVYLVQIQGLAPGMAVPAVVAIGMQLVVAVLTVLGQRRMQTRLVNSEAQLQGTVFSLFSGVQKIKLAGAETRAFHRWATSYQPKAKAQYAPPFSLILLGALGPCVSILGSVLIYVTGAANLSLSSYMAFQSAYGLCSSAIMSLTAIAGQLAGVGPTLELARPLLEQVPETSGEREAVHSLDGRIDATNLSFAYEEGGPNVIDGVDLSIAPGSYVAIVGTTGCGKSTLLRLLLGFEKPQVGSVFYDGKDIGRLDIASLRRHIGTVLQDGKLFPGSIFGNIVICAPEKTMDVAWEAAEVAQIADDIRSMPMGMQTDVTGGGISGGQRQRVLIARAVAAKPSVLIFDEATSALDNVTQAKVSEALDAMACTRIVVAHRLSTIRHCERIVVLDQGRIAEDGTYEELVRAGGLFAKLVERQQVG